MSGLSKDFASPSVASTSQEGQQSRRLKVTLLSSEWSSSTDGDVSTISRELAIQLAKFSNVEVSVFLPQCSDEDRRNAASHNVQLIEAEEMVGMDPVDWLAYVPHEHEMHCVLGHGVTLGKQVQFIKKVHHHSKWIQVVHTTPEELGIYRRNISEGEKQQKEELKLCQLADEVVAIGPKLADAYKRYLRSVKKEQNVFDLTPGIFSEFLDREQAGEEGKTFCVLVIGSGNSCEDFNLKGFDIAVKAIVELNDPSYQLWFVCSSRGNEVAEKLLQHGISRNQLIVRSSNDSREVLANLFYEVDLAIMPSRSEGFGLPALEALSALLPVLVSGNSGLGVALKEVPLGSRCVVDSEYPKDWAREIKAVRQKSRKVRLSESKLLCEHYAETFDWEKPCTVLMKKMQTLAFGSSDNRSAMSVRNKRPTSVADTFQAYKRPREELTDGTRCEDQNSKDLSELSGSSEDKKNPKDPAVEWRERKSSASGTPEESHTQSLPLPVTDTSDNEEGVPVGTKGWSLLHYAAKSGDEDGIEALLSSGLVVDSTDANGRTPLMVAAFMGEEETVNLLLRKGANPHHKDVIGRNLLHAAAEGGNLSIVQRMLSRDINIDINSSDKESSATSLIIAVKENRFKVVEYLLKNGADASRTTSTFANRNALHIAAMTGYVASIKMLLSSISIDSRDAEGNTPLLLAARSGNAGAVKYLLDQNANPSLENNEELGLFYLAALSGNVATIEALLSKEFNIDARCDKRGLTPLMVCLSQGRLEAAEYLLNRGADGKAQCNAGVNALSVAALNGSVAALKMLQGRGYDLASRDGCNMTPLMWAKKRGNLAAEEYLSQVGS